MNWDEIKGNWHILKGKAKAKWDKLSDDTLSQLEGSKDALVAKLQEAYGYTKEQAETAVEEFRAHVNSDKEEDSERNSSKRNRTDDSIRENHPDSSCCS